MKYLTKEVWDKYAHKKCKKQVDFKVSITPALRQGSCNLVMCAGSSRSYKDFAELFAPFIFDLHGQRRTDLKRNDLHYNSYK